MQTNHSHYIIEFLLWSPTVYSGLDHLMVEICKIARANNKQIVCVYCETMENMPALGQDIINAGGIVELVSGDTRQMLRDIRAIYRKYRPEVVNTHFVHPAKLYTSWLSFCYGAKHFTHVHSLMGNVHQYQKEKGMLKRCAVGIYYWLQKRMSKQVFCVSKVAKEQYQTWGYGNCRNVQVLHLGTQLKTPAYTQKQAREQLHLPKDKTIIANVSAIEPIKGIDIIINALALLKQQGKEIVFVHIGGLRSNTKEERQYADSLRQLAIALGVDSQIFWLGKRNDVQDILPLADIYVHPSRSEGLPSALLEAAVSGLPLIGTRVGGIPEMVVDKKTGILIAPLSDDSMAAIQQTATELSKAIEHTLADKERYCQNAKEYVYVHFNQIEQAKQLWQVYMN